MHNVGTGGDAFIDIINAGVDVSEDISGAGDVPVVTAETGANDLLGDKPYPDNIPPASGPLQYVSMLFSL